MSEPPRLDIVLHALAGTGRLGHLTLSMRPSSGYQGGHKPPMGTGYRVATADNPVDALLGALAPPYGMSWDDHLGTKGAAAEAAYASMVTAGAQSDGRHAFVPAKGDPTHCAVCGYAAHEKLQHSSKDLPAKIEEDTPLKATGKALLADAPDAIVPGSVPPDDFSDLI